MSTPPTDNESAEDLAPAMSEAEPAEESSPDEPLLPDTARRAEHEWMLQAPEKMGCCNNSQSRAWMFGSLAALLAMLLFGTFYYHATEDDWTLEDAWFFSVVSLTTVGYGVLTPSEGTNHVVTTMFIICSVTAGTIAVGTITATSITSVLESADKLILETDPDKEPMRPGLAFALAWKRLRTHRLITLGLCILVALIGSGFMCLLEGWSYADAFYFSVVTMSTVGYGDMNPKPKHRFAASIYVLLCTAVFAFSISQLLATFVSRARAESAREFMRTALTIEKLNTMDVNGDQSVSKAEFRIFMLTRLGFVDQATMNEIDASFDLIDADGSGTLDVDDLVGAEIGGTLREAAEHHDI